MSLVPVLSNSIHSPKGEAFPSLFETGMISLNPTDPDAVMDNKLAHINSLTRVGNYKPTQQEIDFKNEITKKIDIELAKLYTLFENKVQALNKKVKESTIDFIQLD